MNNESKDLLLQQIKNLHNSAQNVEELLGNVISSVSKRDILLYEVVEQLGPSLTHKNPTERGIGTRFLADLLHALPRSKINEEELSFLTSFFVDRLKDHHSVIPSVIYGFQAMVEQENISDQDVLKLLQGLFRDVHCQSQIMSDRRNFYTLLKYCLLNKLKVVQEMGSDFVLGFITAMDGEKDPRNLVLLFSLVPNLVNSLPLGPFSEDMFEVVAAYFPIDFVPPPDDPYGISSEDLVLGLRQALAASPQFAPFCFPLLQEKLDSDLASAKLDALHTLVSCCEVYTAEDVRPHVSLLWPSIRREVVEGGSAEREAAALSALTAVLMALERGAVSLASRDTTSHLTKSALMECIGHLTAPEQRLMFPSADLLLAFVVAAQGPAQVICDQVIPLLVNQFVSKTEEAARKNTITILARFLEGGAKYSSLKGENGSLRRFEELCWNAFSHGIKCDVVKVQEATVLAFTVALPAFRPEYLHQAAQILTSLLVSIDSDSLRDSIIKCFVALGKIQPSAVSDHILPHLLQEVEEGTCRSTNVESGQILETLAILTSERLLVSRVLPVVWNRAEYLLSLPSVDQCCLHLSCLRKILTNTMNDTECQRYILEEWSGLLKVVTLALRALTAQDMNNPVPVLQHLSALCRILVSKIGHPQPVVQSILGLAVTGDTDCLQGLAKEIVSKVPEVCSLLHKNTDEDDGLRAAYMVYIYEGFLLGVRKDVEIEGLEHMLGKLRIISMMNVGLELQKTSAVLHAAIINKMPLGPSLTYVVNTCNDELTRVIESSDSVEKRRAALRMLTWMCKALVLRGLPEEAVWTAKMQSLLYDPGIGLDAAQSFEVILKDHEYAFRPDTFANIRLLYKQRYFESVVGPLVDIFTSTEGSTRQNALLAVSSLLPCLPQLVLNSHIKRLLPVLLHGVTCNEATVRESTLSTLATLLQQSVLHAAPHIGTLIPNLILLTSNHPLNVRIKALKCLSALSSLPTPTVLPYRNDVVQGLKIVLNDKKRVVRQSATTTRCAWLLVGSPGGAS